MFDLDLFKELDLMDPVGRMFQEETKHHREQMRGRALDWHSRPQLYKDYPKSKKIELPAVLCPNDYAFYNAVKKRRSIRKFTDAPISTESLSYLLWASTGISREENGCEFRTAPSAGALYPIETYLCINNVEGLEPGIYHYSIKNHQLEVLRTGDFAIDSARAALDQRMCIEAAVVFVWTAIFQRSKWKYDQRAYRYVYLDVGHMAENLALAAVSIGLGSCHIAAIYDDEANSLVGVDGTEESVVYMTVVGHPS